MWCVIDYSGGLLAEMAIGPVKSTFTYDQPWPVLKTENGAVFYDNPVSAFLPASLLPAVMSHNKLSLTLPCYLLKQHFFGNFHLAGVCISNLHHIIARCQVISIYFNKFRTVADFYPKCRYFLTGLVI